VSLTIRSLCRATALLCLSASPTLWAAPIYPGEPTETEPGGRFSESERLSNAPLLEASPVPTNKSTTLPELFDPLGLGVESGLRIFSGNVHFMDLLANPGVDDPSESVAVELPPGTLRDINILDDMDSVYMSYDGRAFDKNTLMNIENVEIMDRKGVPVTSESSPVSLTGFGIIIPKTREMQ
jgi:hypothetical protein